jgi:hypothetical protein
MILRQFQIYSYDGIVDRGRINARGIILAEAMRLQLSNRRVVGPVGKICVALFGSAEFMPDIRTSIFPDGVAEVRTLVDETLLASPAPGSVEYMKTVVAGCLAELIQDRELPYPEREFEEIIQTAPVDNWELVWEIKKLHRNDRASGNSISVEFTAEEGESRVEIVIREAAGTVVARDCIAKTRSGYPTELPYLFEGRRAVIKDGRYTILNSAAQAVHTYSVPCDKNRQ